MKLIVNIAGLKVLLPVAAAETIVELLAGAEYLENKYIGAKSPTNYIDIITPFQSTAHMQATLMDDVAYEALKLVTKLHHEAEKK